MDATRDILGQIDSLRAAQLAQQAAVAHTGNDGVVNQEAGERTQGSGGTIDLRVPGVMYAVPYDAAIAKGWQLEGARPAARAGAFVYDRATHKGAHKFVVPATLQAEFMVGSTLLEESEESEINAGGASERVTAPVFPNMDLILANARSSPKDFVKYFIQQGWATSTAAVGPLAQLVQQHMHRPTVQKALEEHQASKEILVFDVLLSFAQFAKGRQGDTLWMGCPALPHQLLAVIQRGVAAQAGATWQPPALNQTVALLGDLAKLADQARRLARTLVFGASADWAEVRDLLRRAEEMKPAIVLFTSWGWEEACSLLHSTDLPSAIDLLRERLAAQSLGNLPDRAGEGRGFPGVPTAAPTFVIAREPADGESKLTPEERDQLEEACRDGSTTDIDISRARLLTEATGTAIIALQPGGPDISRVKLSYFAENLILQVHQEIATNDSLRKIPLVTLAKVFSLRLTQSDNFVFEHMGLLLCEDFSPEVSLTKVRGSAQGAHVIKAKKHIWAPVQSAEQMANVVEGLAICAKRLHHPSVLSHQEIGDLWAKLKAVFVTYGGHAHVPGLFQVFEARIEEHALAIRTAAQGASRRLPPLQELQPRSEALFHQVCEAAKQQCLRDYVALRSGPGETAYGAAQSLNAGLDADGRRGSYPRHAKAQKGAGATEKAPSTGSHTPAQNQPASGVRRTQSQHEGPGQAKPGPKRAKKAGETLSHCVRCGKLGHMWYGCEEPWCQIPGNWPGFLKSLAAKVRSDHGISLVYEKDRAGPPPARQN